MSSRYSSYSKQRNATPYSTGRRLKKSELSPSYNPQMAVVSWENVLVPMDWLVVYLGLNTSIESIQAAGVRCHSSPELLQALTTIEDRIIQLLSETTRVVQGPVFIVSEYATTYVELVSSLFFPRLTAALRSSTGGIYVVGTPNTELNMHEMKQWKVNLLRTAVCEHLFAGVSTRDAVNVLSRTTIKVVALCASDADVVATSAINLIAPKAFIKHIKAGCNHLRSPQTPVSLDEFYTQLERMAQFVRQNA